MTQLTLFTRDKVLPGVLQYSVIRKLSMAISGLIMVAFLYGHFAGNSVLFSGEMAFVEYYNWLQSHPFLHYSVWLIISGALLAHLSVGVYHWVHNRTVRPVRYKKKRYQATNWAARSMIVSGFILVIFLIFHIAHVRGLVNFSDVEVEQHISPIHSPVDSNKRDMDNPAFSMHTIVASNDMLYEFHFLRSQSQIKHTPAEVTYQNLIAGFEKWSVVIFYIIAQIALAVHLYHGLWSQFQTLGIYHPRYNHLRRLFAILIGVGIALLNSSLVLLNTPVGKQLLENLS
jgi:succinate dehydrogenase / fumarate reductase cytochrome b subunit